MHVSRCSYCGERCDHPVRLNFIMSGRDRESPGVTTLRLCTACSNSWCTVKSLKSREREEWVGTGPREPRWLKAG
jgi:hypothetical protein